MKTQTKNTNFGKRNFLSILFLALFFLFNSVYAQNTRVRTVNTAPSGCDWIVTVYDASTPPVAIGTYTSNGGSGSTLSPCFTGLADYLTITDVAGNCTMITFGSGGVFNYTAVSPSCTPSSCSSQITCSGGLGVGICSTPTMFHILIEIQ